MMTSDLVEKSVEVEACCYFLPCCHSFQAVSFKYYTAGAFRATF
jgi:hypothetical protein